MKAEHWNCDDGEVIFPIPHKQKKFLTENGTFCCTIIGKNWNDIMRKYHKHMGWEPYKPMDLDTKRK